MPSFMPSHIGPTDHQSHFNRHARIRLCGMIHRAARGLAAALAVTALALTSGCSGSGNTAASSSSSGLRKVTFMLSWAPDTNHIGVYVGVESVAMQ